MKKAVFTLALITNNEEIDNQHKELIEKINAFFEAQTKEVALETFDFLVKYTEYHFASEEQGMVETRYPQRSAHMKIHQDLVDSVLALRDELDAEGPTEAFLEKVDTQITEWLYVHIQKADMAFAQYKNMKMGMNDML